MNVFVLNTGRCGSDTFIRACSHITNFTAGHETRTRLIGDDRLAYPPDHIEADNRLSWLLGRLDQTYGDAAIYVHLTRDPNAVARSLVNRFHSGIMRAYYRGVCMSPDLSRYTQTHIALDYCDTITRNIELFLRDKTRVLRFRLENAEADFRNFWQVIGGEGDLDAALAEWRITHNRTTWRDVVGKKRRALFQFLGLRR